MLKSSAAAAAATKKPSAATSPSSSSSSATSAPVSSSSASPPAPLTRISLNDLCGLQKGKDNVFTNQTADVSALRSAPFLIVDVWSDNLREVFDKLIHVVDEFPYVAMDTEFPGIVARPLTTATGKNLTAYHYQTIKLNVDLLKLIQLGLCFCNADGEVSKGLPGTNPAPSANASAAQAAATQQAGGIVYQFHFKFSLADDMYAQDSIDLLTASGIDFARHQSQGIDITDFSELLMTSGVILNDEIRWLTFHSGFDFAYLLNLLIGGGQGLGADASLPTLPASEGDFFELISIYFPCIYDIKSLIKSLPESTPNLAELQRGGLQKMAAALGIARIGKQHQAGSDALLTAAVFFKIREMFFRDIIPPSMAELQQAAAAASAAVLAQSDKEKEKDKGDKEKEKDSKERDREKEAYAAATDKTASMLWSYQQEEEKYLNLMYGLLPTANALLRMNRDRERAQIAGAGDDDTTSVASTTANNSTATTAASSRSSSRLERSPVAAPFKPANSNVPDFN